MFNPSFAPGGPKWKYESYILDLNSPGKNYVSWASGDLYMEDSIDPPEGDDTFRLVGHLQLQGGATLQIAASGFTIAELEQCATFRATGNITAPAAASNVEYLLTGWVFGTNGKASRIEGAIMLSQGLSSAMKTDPTGNKVGTTGFFSATL